jgi:hypothetical protein
MKLMLYGFQNMNLQQESNNLNHEDGYLTSEKFHLKTGEQKFHYHLDRFDFEDFDIVFVDGSSQKIETVLLKIRVE